MDVLQAGNSSKINETNPKLDLQGENPLIFTQVII